MENKKVSMAIKEKIAEDSANAYFTYNIDGEILGYSEINKTKTLIYRLLEYYTNIEMPIAVKEENESDEDFYDRAYDEEAIFIDENCDFFDSLISENKTDYDLIMSAINAKIEFKKKKIEDDASIAKVIVKLLQKFLEKAPDSAQMQQIFDNFKNLDLNKLDNVMELKKLIG